MAATWAAVKLKLRLLIVGGLLAYAGNGVVAVTARTLPPRVAMASAIRALFAFTGAPFWWRGLTGYLRAGF
jgi:hypothetical protein